MPSISLRVATAFIVTCALLPAAQPAAANPPTHGSGFLARAIEYLDTHPGGVIINDNEISYAGGAFIVTLTPPVSAEAGVPDCPAGWYCFYDRVDYGYPRGKLSSCGTQNLANWSWQYRTESAHYNLARGSVTFYYNSTSLFSVSVARPAIADVAPHWNRANIVTRFC